MKFSRLTQILFLISVITPFLSGGNTVQLWNMASVDYSDAGSGYGESYPGPFGPAGWTVSGWNNIGGSNPSVPGMSMVLTDTTDDIVRLEESQAYPFDDYNNTYGYIAMTSSSFYLDGTLDYRVGVDMSWLSEYGESDFLYAVLTDASYSIDYYSMYLGLNSSNNGLIWTNHNSSATGMYFGGDVLYSQGQFSAVGNYKLTLMFKYDGYIYNPLVGSLSEGLSSLDIDTVFLEDITPSVPAPGAVFLAGTGIYIAGFVRRRINIH